MGKEYNKSLVCLAVPLPSLLKGGEELEASLELFKGGFGVGSADLGEIHLPGMLGQEPTDWGKS